MFKTLDLSQILLTLNNLKTEFTPASEDKTSLLSISCFVVDETQGAESLGCGQSLWNLE